MKKLSVILMCILMMFSAFNVFAAEDEGVNVYVNGIEIKSDVGACITEGRTMLPVRAVCEAVGAVVEWNEENQSVTIKNKENKTVLFIGKNEAINYINGEEEVIEFDVGVQIVSGRTLVPVRFVTESMGASVSWDEQTRSVYIDIEIKPELIIGDTKITLDTDAKLLESPDRIDRSIRGLEWYVYNSDYNLYRMAAVKDGKVVGFFTNAKDFYTSFGTEYMKKAESCKLAGYSVRIYSDSLNDNLTAGILCVKSDAENALDTTGNEFLKTQAMEQFDMINAFRAANDEYVLEWDDHAAEAANMHSLDMAQNNYFSHDSLDGMAVIDRYLSISENIHWTAIGENIEGGHMYGCESFFALYNSAGHRNNMLSSIYKYAGIGVNYSSASDYGYYTVQVFVSY